MKRLVGADARRDLPSLGSAASLALLVLAALWAAPAPTSGEVAALKTRGDASFVVHVSYDNEFVGSCDPVTMTVQFRSEVIGGEPLYSYNWSFGDGGSSMEANPVHTYTATAILRDLTVVVIVSDANSTTAAGSLPFRPVPPPCAPPFEGGTLVIPWVVLILCIAACVSTVLIFHRSRRDGGRT